MPRETDLPSSASHGDEQPNLYQQNQKLLVELNRKLQLIHDRVVGVVKGYHTGCAITGRGGTCKSRTVIGTLEQEGSHFVLHNSHLTPRGLVDELAINPSAVHVFEDVEELLRNQGSLGVLRSATWGSRPGRDGRSERLITWGAHGARQEVIFDGGIILIANRKLSDIPEAKALATRIPTIDLVVSDAEIAALMRSVAAAGHQIGDKGLSPGECMEVADFIIRESARVNRPLDMRLLIAAFADRLQAEDYEAGCGWRDLVASTLRGRPSIVEVVEPVGIRKQKKARELDVAREIVSLPRQERLREWKEKTGASEASLYRRLAQLGTIDATRFDM